MERIPGFTKGITNVVALATLVAGFFVWIVNEALARRTGWPYPLISGAALNTAGRMVVQTLGDLVETAVDYWLLPLILAALLVFRRGVMKLLRRKLPKVMTAISIERTRLPWLGSVLAVLLISTALIPATLIKDQMSPQSLLVTMDRPEDSDWFHQVARSFQSKQICRAIGDATAGAQEELAREGIDCKGARYGKEEAATKAIRNLYVSYVVAVAVIGLFLILAILRVRKGARARSSSYRLLVPHAALFAIVLLGAPWFYGTVRSDLNLDFGRSRAGNDCTGYRVPSSGGQHVIYDPFTASVSGVFPDTSFAPTESKNVFGDRIGRLLNIQTDMSKYRPCVAPPPE